MTLVTISSSLMTSGSLGTREETSMLPQKFYQDPSCPTSMPPGGVLVVQAPKGYAFPHACKDYLSAPGCSG